MANEKGVYIFQGESIVVPMEIPDSRLHEGINEKLFESSFAGIIGMDRFTIPSIDSQSFGGQDTFSAVSIPEGKLPAGWKAIPIRQSLSIITGGSIAQSRGPAGRILRSYHINQWRKESRYCGSCGALNTDADNGELARKCSVCGRNEFPRISPAIIVIITNDKDEAALAHNNKFIPGVYSLIAGFNEAGESLEDTVAREIKEEINLKVKDIRYICSQPWPFPNSLMLGFSARHESGDLRPDGIELEDARWFSRDNLPNLPSTASVSRYLINLWISGVL